eukprot:2372132-Rhodomonas_salina.2
MSLCVSVSLSVSAYVCVCVCVCVCVSVRRPPHLIDGILKRLPPLLLPIPHLSTGHAVAAAWGDRFAPGLESPRRPCRGPQTPPPAPGTEQAMSGPEISTSWHRMSDVAWSSAPNRDRARRAMMCVRVLVHVSKCAVALQFRVSGCRAPPTSHQHFPPR